MKRRPKKGEEDKTKKMVEGGQKTLSLEKKGSAHEGSDKGQIDSWVKSSSSLKTLDWD